jgi:hypothetical protein
MKRSFLSLPLVALAIALISCSGRSSIAPGPIPNISGPWEFIAASSNSPGSSTGIEVALQEGQIFAGGIYAETGQISASGLQINFVGISPGAHQTSPPNIVFGGNCAPDSAGNSLSGSVSGVGGNMNFTFAENGSVYDVTAILDASGQSIDSGTYTLQSGPGCGGDTGGTITRGQIVPKLAGTYTGKLCEPLDSACSNGAQDGATVTLSESSGNLTANMILTGADNTSFSLQGPVTGNAFFVQGTFEGQSVNYYGYYELTYDSSDNTYDIQTLYLVNATNSAEPTHAGTLTVPLIP